MASDVFTAQVVAAMIEEALTYELYLQPAAIASVVPHVRAAAVGIRQFLVGQEVTASRTKLEAEAKASDGEHDRAQRLLHGLTDNFARNGKTVADREAAAVLQAQLHPDGLQVVNLPYLVEVANVGKLSARLRNASVIAALEVLAQSLPGIRGYADDIVAAGAKLGSGLAGLRALDVDKAGKPFDPALFKARTDALVWWSAFVQLVEAIYRGDAPDKKAARVALLGTWHRLLSLDPKGGTAAEGDAGGTVAGGTD